MSSKRTDAMDESTVILQSNERHKMAKKKRLLQLKRYNQYEKQLEKSSAKKVRKSPSRAKDGPKEVKFVGRVRLLEAAARNDIDEVRQLLEAGVSPDVTNDDGLTAMHQCCIDNFEEMLCLLIEYGAKVNACDSELWTPLHAAAACGHLNLCRHLINNGSDLMAVNCDGMMAYDICDNEATLDYIETEMTKRGITQQLIDDTRNLRELNMLKDVKELASQGFDLNYKGRNGETFLHIASCNGYLDVTQFLLQQPSVNINAVDNELWQPAHCAVCWNQEFSNFYWSTGASLEAKTRNGETALDICEDEELKHQILEMRDHWQRNKQVKSRDLVHKPSNVRSSSVRRSSMKQRKATSMKEALEEGKLLTVAAMTTNHHHDNHHLATTNSDNANASLDDCNELNSSDNKNNNRSSFNFKDKIRGSINRQSHIDSSQSSSLPSNAGSGNTERSIVQNIDEGDQNALLSTNRRCPSYKSNEVSRTADVSYYARDNNNDNNNIIRLGTPLQSALKKTTPATSTTSSSSSSKSDGCCTIV